MAKDGTNRGGPRVGAGRKPKPLVDKINSGQHAEIIEFPEPADLFGNDVPPVKEYMLARQKDGESFAAEEIYRETYLWLKERGCAELINVQLISQYAMSVARWIACENAISQYGYLAKHPTSGQPITSPYVNMSQNYIKQANALWFQIQSIVKANCSVEYQGAAAPGDMMEMLLRSRKD